MFFVMRGVFMNVMVVSDIIGKWNFEYSLCVNLKVVFIEIVEG